MLSRTFLKLFALASCASLSVACPEEKKADGSGADVTDASQSPDQERDGGATDEKPDGEKPDDEKPDDEKPGEHEGDGGSTETCLAHNGELNMMNGSFAATVTNADANLTVPAPGTLPCEATFSAEGGVGLMDGSSTGAISLTCWGAQDDLYFGLVINAFGKWEAGKAYPFGFAGSVPSGAGYVSNGEASLTYEEGPRCESKQDKSAAWDAQRDMGGELRIDAVDGEEVTFTIHEASFAPGTIGNYVGTGMFKLSGTGTVKPADI